MMMSPQYIREVLSTVEGLPQGHLDSMAHSALVYEAITNRDLSSRPTLVELLETLTTELVDSLDIDVGTFTYLHWTASIEYNKDDDCFEIHIDKPLDGDEAIGRTVLELAKELCEETN